MKLFNPIGAHFVDVSFSSSHSMHGFVYLTVALLLAATVADAAKPKTAKVDERDCEGK